MASSTLVETRVALTSDLRELLDALLQPLQAVAAAEHDDNESQAAVVARLEDELRSALLPPSTTADDDDDGTSPNDQPGVTHDLIKRVGWWAQSDIGRQALLVAQLDPSAYHPHSLLSSTTTLLPARITRPPSSPSNPDLAPSSPYLPPSSQRPARAAQSPGQDWGAVGKQAGAVVNVIFSAAGVGGGVYWLGGHGHKWSQTKSVLLALFAFLAVVAVEVALYAIHFSRLERARKLDERAEAKWRAGGLTTGVERVELPLIEPETEVAAAVAGRGSVTADTVDLEVNDGADITAVASEGKSDQTGVLMPDKPTPPIRISLRRRGPGEALDTSAR